MGGTSLPRGACSSLTVVVLRRRGHGRHRANRDEREEHRANVYPGARRTSWTWPAQRLTSR